MFIYKQVRANFVTMSTISERKYTARKKKIRENYKNRAKHEVRMGYNKDQYYKDKYVESLVLWKYIDRSRQNVIYRIVQNLVGRATKSFTKKHVERQITHTELLGCSPEVLKEHLEKQFTEEIDFKNYGKWEVDHIIPIDSFDLSDVEEVKKCFHYTNLQPLWREDNIKKSNKILQD